VATQIGAYSTELFHNRFGQIEDGVTGQEPLERAQVFGRSGER
jgi:hypothetical protein